jgi:hypothetical protein
MEKVITLSEVFETADHLPWNEALYLPIGKRWTLKSPAVVCSPDACEEGQEVPEIARQNGLTYAVGVSAMQDIVANATAQRPSCSLEELLDAFLFYYTNDAFVRFE